METIERKWALKREETKRRSQVIAQDEKKEGTSNQGRGDDSGSIEDDDVKKGGDGRN